MLVLSSQAKYDAAANSFAADTVPAVLEAVKAAGDGDLSEKQLKQMAMPFAKYKMDEALRGKSEQVRHVQLRVVFDKCLEYRLVL
jgi:hypothetical protein